MSVQGSIVVGSPNNCCYEKATIVPFLFPYAAINNIKVFTVAMGKTTMGSLLHCYLATKCLVLLVNNDNYYTF